MNITEFAALKVGDKIVNAFAGTTGTVTAADRLGVSVCWHTGTRSFPYSFPGTAWMHWDKVEIVVIDPLSEHLAKVEADPAATFTDEQWDNALKGTPT